MIETIANLGMLGSISYLLTARLALGSKYHSIKKKTFLMCILCCFLSMFLSNKNEPVIDNLQINDPHNNAVNVYKDLLESKGKYGRAHSFFITEWRYFGGDEYKTKIEEALKKADNNGTASIYYNSIKQNNLISSVQLKSIEDLLRSEGINAHFDPEKLNQQVIAPKDYTAAMLSLLIFIIFIFARLEIKSIDIITLGFISIAIKREVSNLVSNLVSKNNKHRDFLEEYMGEDVTCSR
ncbi:hypothetical protein A3715_13960 [Oleiphilus sp. HI0009]|nr:hypothetical protein A3715_13960 [Oleiphilus sp. HI0009]